MMVYPADVGVQQLLTFDPCLQTAPTIFNGTMTLNDVNMTQGNFDYVLIDCTGLKPLTRHFLYLDGVIEEAFVKQEGSNVGDPLVTDGSGRIKLRYLVNDVWLNKVDDVVLAGVPRDAYNDPVLRNGRNSVTGNRETGKYDEIKIEVAYAMFELRVDGSSAYALMSLLTPNKTF